MDLRKWIDRSFPVWMRWSLWMAALFDVYWGGKLLFRDEPLWPFGLLAMLMGVGFLLAGFQPRRHWGVVFVGLLGKVLGPIGYFLAASAEGLPWSGGWAVFFYGLVWWVPFALILRKAWEPRPPRPRSSRPPRGRSNRPGRRFDDRPTPDRRPRPEGQGSGPGARPQDSRDEGYDPRRRRRRRGPRRDGPRRDGGPRDGGPRDGDRRDGGPRDGGRREGPPPASGGGVPEA